MFNLIITIIAIALVVVLTATSVYYGGSAFSEGTADAIAATYINQAQQVQAAAVLYTAQEGGAPTLLNQLSNHLSSTPVTPDGSQWELLAAVPGTSPGAIFVGSTIGAKNDIGLVTFDVCEKINANGSQLVNCFDDAAGTPGLSALAAVAATAASTNVVIRMAF